MVFEHVDVQWTVVARSSPQEAFAAVMTRAKALEWSFEDLEVKDSDGTCLLPGDEWPSETMGSARYMKRKSGEEKYSLFWSTYSDGELCKITGGLYIKQYASGCADFEPACSRALDDLRRLFDCDEVLCIILTLEDDDGIDIAPGIVGLYRPTIWRVTSELPLKGITREAREGWIEVRPEGEQGAEPHSVFSMAEETTEAIQRIQSVLEAELWVR